MQLRRVEIFDSYTYRTVINYYYLSNFLDLLCVYVEIRFTKDENMEQRKRALFYLFHESAKSSDTGTRTLVSCVKGKYANHLHHIGAFLCSSVPLLRYTI